MQLRTYTGLWKVEKRLYKFYDINLPYPVSLRQVGIFFVALVPWLALMTLLRVPVGSSVGFVAWFGPPIAIAIYANRPIAEGKTLWDYGYSQVRFLVSPRTYAALIPRPDRPRAYRMRGEYWRAGTSPSTPPS